MAAILFRGRWVNCVKCGYFCLPKELIPTTCKAWYKMQIDFYVFSDKINMTMVDYSKDNFENCVAHKLWKVHKDINSQTTTMTGERNPLTRTYQSAFENANEFFQYTCINDYTNSFLIYLSWELLFDFSLYKTLSQNFVKCFGMR